MLNIAIWGKFFVIIQTHRDIRYDEVYAQIMYEHEDESKLKKELHLTRFKKKGCVMNIVVVVLATALSIAYIYYAVNITEDIFIADPYESGMEFYVDYNKTLKMQWIVSTIFSGVIVLLSLSLLIKLRVRFDDFYAEYGCFLWTIFTIQALSMIFQATVRILRIYN